MTESDNKLTKKERKELKKQQKRERLSQEEQKEKSTRLLRYILVGLVALGLGGYFYSRIIPVDETEKEKVVDRVMENDWVKGSPEAKNVLIEYSDFECSACKTYAKILDNLEASYSADLAIVYRHNPLKQIHKTAELAAYAAEAAGKQNKFWEMHDILFDRAEEWAENRTAKDLLIGYAEGIGLDKEKFKQDLDSKEIKGLVKADYLSALRWKLMSTPRFFLNGEQLPSFKNPEDFVRLIEGAVTATASAKIKSVE